MASPSVALIQQILLHGADRSPRVLPLRISDAGAETGDQQAPHHPPVQEEKGATHPRLSDRRPAGEERSVGAVLRRMIRQNLTQG
jgi:hypothetical protein